MAPFYGWYSFYRPRKDERLSRPWRHPVVLNTGPLDWESSVLTTRPLLHIYQSIPHNKYLNPQAPKDALCVYVISEKAVYAILQCHWYQHLLVCLSQLQNLSLREKCPYSELFWSAFPRIRIEYGCRKIPECWKMRTRITPNTNTFYAVFLMTVIVVKRNALVNQKLAIC